MKLNAGDVFPALAVKNIHDAPVSIPDAKAKYVHLQFRRFAGCPVCNLHLQSFLRRDAEIKAAGVHETVVFHSSNEALLPYQGKFPFDVIGDPKKELYRRFGVESSLLALLDPRAWPAIIKGNLAADKPAGAQGDGVLGLPADFLIGPDGKVAAAHYGAHADDQWSVDELLSLAK